MNKKSIRSFLCNFFLCMIAVLALSGGKAEAATKVQAPSLPQKLTAYAIKPTSKKAYVNTYASDGYKLKTLDSELINYISIKNLTSDAKVYSVKSSNSNIMTASYMDGSLYVKIKKFGTATLSCKVKQNGKIYKISCKYTVKATPTPFKNVEIAGKQYASKFTGKWSYTYTTKKSSVKLNITPKSNVKLIKISLLKPNGKRTVLKNNTTLKLTQKGTYSLFIDIKYTDKKSLSYNAERYLYIERK